MSYTLDLFSGTLIKSFKVNYLKKLHFSLQLLICYHNVRCVLLINGTNYK